MHGKISARATALAVLLGAALSRPSHGFDKPDIQAGVIMGYTDGQNGQGWPQPWSTPLQNYNRAGFYVSMLRVKGAVAFDSTFSAVAVENFAANDMQEVYLQKSWDTYRLKLGKFRGAGLKSASGTDEFDRIAVNAPRYARAWSGLERTLNNRDFGVQIEHDQLGGAMTHKFFLRNANFQNVGNDEPSFPVGGPTQALGLDYELDWRISPYTAWSGHLGAVADREWDEFVGRHQGWQVQYWFKSNPIVDASLDHQMDLGRFHMSNEALILYNRELPDPVDSNATKTWGVSSLVRWEHNRRFNSFYRYEFFDPTDGAVNNDALHMFTLGGTFFPSPEKYPGLKLTAEYVRSLEDGFKDTFHDDLLMCQLQMLY